MADLVENRVSTAPGFHDRAMSSSWPACHSIVMQAMLDNVTPRLETGVKMLMETVQADSVRKAPMRQGLGAIAEKYPDASVVPIRPFRVGSFPEPDRRAVEKSGDARRRARQGAGADRPALIAARAKK